MLPLETGKAGITKTDFEILSSLEYPKTLDQLKRRFPNISVAKKILDLQDKGFVQEKGLKYVCKFYTNDIKKIIDRSRVSDKVKKNFHFFLSQIDNPFVRQGIYDSESREKTEYVLSKIVKSLNKPLSKKESILLKISVEDLLNKLR